MPMYTLGACQDILIQKSVSTQVSGQSPTDFSEIRTAVQSQKQLLLHITKTTCRMLQPASDLRKKEKQRKR